jgi:two-component system, NtrC family, sensor histidine kinase PilS
MLTVIKQLAFFLPNFLFSFLPRNLMTGIHTRLIWLTFSRLVVLLILLSTATVLDFISPNTIIVKTFTTALIFTTGLSIFYGIWLRWATNYSLQAYCQTLIDVLIVSWIVSYTSATEKSFASLYLVVVLAASTVLPRIGVVLTALICVFSYSTVILLLYYQVLLRELAPIILDQSIPLYITAILAVGILGGQIAERLSLSHAELARAAQDLAELQAFNSRIIESIHSGLVTTDTHGSILSFNRAAEDTMGYKALQVINKNFFDIFGDLSQHVEFGKASGLPHRPIRFTVNCQSANKKMMHLGVTACPLADETGATTGLVFSFQDLSEIISLEQEIRRRDRLAAMGKMAAGIAHEIRNPLAAMRGSIQVLRSELELSEDQDYLMQIVLRESDRLDRIVSDFLSYARPSQLKPTPFDLVAVVTESISLLRHSRELSDRQTVVLEAVEPNIYFIADQNQIRQVIWNLIRNALQAMPAGGKLLVKVSRWENKGVQIEFQDTGVGMTTEDMERLFEPFNSSRPGGTGLGLAIVYQIINDHNGKIDVQSQPQQGTKITIQLPSLPIDPDTSSDETKFTDEGKKEP